MVTAFLIYKQNYLILHQRQVKPGRKIVQGEPLSEKQETSHESSDMKPNPIDVHVGQRLRQRRVLAGLSQEKLARMVGITFQQVQKYERGANRIVASRLYQLAQVLDVPVSYFFEHASSEGDRAKSEHRPGLAGLDALSHDIMAERETLELVRTYYSIENETVRRRAFELLRALSNRHSPSLEELQKVQ